MIDRHVDILLVEDNLGDARLLREELLDAGAGRFRLTHETHMSTGVAHLAQGGGADLVLLDLSLPDSDGLESLKKVRAEAPHVPVVVLSGLTDEQLAVEAVRQGAQDYLVKGAVEGDALVRALDYAIERHRLASELEEARLAQLEIKNAFLSHVSHELRTPLTAIYQLASILADGLAGDVTAEQKEHLDVLLRNVDQLKRMIRDLVDMARVEMDKLDIQIGDVDSDRVMLDVCHSMRPIAEEKKIDLVVDHSSLPAVRADAARLYEILLNLVDNAIKFTPEGGNVTVSATRWDEDHRFAKVSVSDTGIGVDPETIDVLFERWYQEERATKSRKGLGLGLHICRELVTRQGGRIWADGTPGRGSVFSFTVPLSDETGDERE